MKYNCYCKVVSEIIDKDLIEIAEFYGIEVTINTNKVVRKLEDLYRIHIPREIREKIGINSISEGDVMLIEVNEYGQIVLTKVDVK